MDKLDAVKWIVSKLKNEWTFIKLCDALALIMDWLSNKYYGNRDLINEISYELYLFSDENYRHAWFTWDITKEEYEELIT